MRVFSIASLLLLFLQILLIMYVRNSKARTNKCAFYTFLVFCKLFVTGVTDYLTTEISTSRSRKFNLVTFIDTPGLVDGDMHYPFDVNETLLWLGESPS